MPINRPNTEEAVKELKHVRKDQNTSVKYIKKSGECMILAENVDVLHLKFKQQLQFVLKFWQINQDFQPKVKHFM